MSNGDFVKGVCGHCAGHLEFPATAAGQTVSCPHCGRATALAVPAAGNLPRASRWPGMGIGLAIGLLAGGIAGAFVLGHRSKPVEDPEAKPAAAAAMAPATNAVVIRTPMVAEPKLAATVPASAPEPTVILETNDFALLPFTLEKTPGSSLVYIIGTVRNLKDQQRFGVKLEFGLLDTNDQAIGSATDYQSVLEPRGEWRFKALVMESKAMSARLDSIGEDK